jgi:hypothetical protein
MAKHSRRRSRSHRHKVKRGGANYSSASTYGTYVAGTANEQYDRVFSQTGPDSGIQSNILTGVQGQNTHQQSSPTGQNLSLIQSAGKRRSRRTRHKKGGLWGEVLNQAIVPFTILGLQQSYKHKKHAGKKTRKYRR